MGAKPVLIRPGRLPTIAALPATLPLVLAIALWLPINTLDAAPNTFNTALPVAKGEFIWRERLVFRERSDDGPMQRDVSIRALGSVLGYGVSGRLSTFVVLPYFFSKSLDVTTGNGRLSRRAEGVGDLSAFAKYTAYQRDFRGGTMRLSAFAGLTAPTGRHDQRDAFGELPRPLQAGDGAWDGFGGVVATLQTLDFQVDAQAAYRDNGRHDGFERGDTARLDASLQYRVWPASLDGLRGTPGFGYLLLESKLVHRDTHTVASASDPNSGGVQWLLAPGAQYIGRRWIVEGTVQVPVVTNAPDAAIRDDAIVRIGFRRNF